MAKAPLPDGTTLVREVRLSYGPTKAAALRIQSSAEAASFFRDRIIPVGADREHFAVLAVDVRYRPVGWRVIAIGSQSAALVHPREVYRPALVIGAAAIFLAHNHPSGDTSPSREDDRITGRLRAAGRLLGVDLVDHLVLGESYYSYRESQSDLFHVPSSD